MAAGRGYLGKISAVVAANTGDYVRKLNEGAAATRSFASTISGDLRRAQADVNKSINSILTPLQKYERAIQNAADKKLAFRGFSGAIATVEDLRKAINRLGDRPTEIEFIVKQSGLKNITEVREAISGLKQSDIDLAVNVGGVEGLRRLRAEVEEVDGRTINVKTKISADRLDELIEKFSAFSADKIKSLQLDVETRELNQAIELSNRLRSVAFEITDAYGKAKAQFAGFSAEVQTALGPSIRETDTIVSNLIETIERGGDVGEAEFRRVAEAARRAASAIGDASEVQSRVGGLRTGRELAFANPRLDDALTRAQRATEAAASLPVGSRASGDVGKLVAEVKRLATAAGVAEAAVTGLTDPSQFSAARAAADGLREKLVAAVQLIEGQIPVRLEANKAISDVERLKASLATIRDNVTFTVTGEVQNFDQARQELSRLTGAVEQFDVTQRSAFGGSLQRLGELIDTRDVAELEQVRRKIAEISAAIGERKRLNVETAEAKKRIDDLKASLATIRENVAFTVTGEVQNFDQARQELSRLTGAVEQFDVTQRSAFGGNLQRLGELIDTKDVTELDQVRRKIAEISAAIGERKQLNIETSEAKQKLDRLKASLADVRDDATFKITGDVQNLEQGEALLRKLASDLDRLNAQQRAGLGAPLQDLSAAIELGDLDLVRSEYQKVKALFDQELQIKLTADEAKKNTDDLRAALIRLADGINPSQPIDILEKNLNEAKAAVDRLDPKLKALGQRDLARVEKFIRTKAASQQGASDADINAAANRLGVIRDRATSLAPQKQAAPQRDPLGSALGSPERAIENIRGRLSSLQGDLDKLPDSISSKFIPEVNKLRAAFDKLGPGSASADIDDVLRRTQQLGKQIELNAQANARFGGTFAEFANQQSLESYSRKLDFLRRQLVGVPGDTKQAEDALDQMAAAGLRAAGTANGFTQFAAELNQVEKEAVEASAAVRGISPKALGAQLKSIGDVSRGGTDKVSLAFQQAAFAFEDFFSVTGGLDQRIRAAGNNLSQLGFILGGTTGLVAGISAAIGGQLVAALIKWYNAGVGSEDQVKQLNDSLARQKSLVEELAQAFRSLGDSIARKAFSAPAQEAREFARALEDIEKKQQRVRKERIASLDPAVQLERGIQSARQRELENAEDPGVRVALARQIAESRQRELEAADRASGRVVSDVDIRQGIADSIQRLGDARAADAALRAGRGGTTPAAGAAAAARENERTRRELREFLDRDLSLEGLRKELEGRIASLSERGVASTGLFASSTQRAAAKELAQLTSLLESLRLPENVRADETIRTIFDSANKAASAIENAHKDVAAAIQAGVPGLRVFQTELNRLGKELDAATAALEAAQLEDPSTESGRQRRDARIADAERRVANARAREEEVTRQADAARFAMTVDPQSTTQARMERAQQNLSAAGAESGMIARRLREIEFQRETLRRMADARPNDPLTQRLVQESERALGEQVQELLAASRALRSFTESLNEASQEAEGNLNSARQRADDARRADLGRSTPASRANRAQAERNLEEQRQANARVQDAISVERSRLEEQALTGRGPLAGVFAELEAIDEEISRGNVGAARYAELIAERRRLEEQVNQEASKANAVIAARDDSTRIAERQASARRGDELSLTPAQRAAEQMAQGTADINAYFDEISQSIIDAANGLPDQAVLQQNEARRREALARFERDINDALESTLKQVADRIKNRENPVGDPLRGEELSLSPAARAAQQIAQSVADINAYFDAAADVINPDGIIQNNNELERLRQNERERAAAVERFQKEENRRLAPMLYDMMDQVQTAVMQGPSRAALSANDASTSQGQAELNRLIRGDDDARNVNLAEMQRQTQLLRQIANKPLPPVAG